MTITIELIIRIAAAALIAVFFGNGSVVAFNRTPAKWFEDYPDENEEGDALSKGISGEPETKVLPYKLLEADAMGRQRLPSTPWKYAFTGYFAICGLWLAIRGASLTFEISALCVLFITLEMAIADQLYRIVPDQFSIALAFSSIAFLGYYDKWWEQLAGGLLGLGISLAVLLLGMLLFKTGSIGGADIKFFACMGLVVGRTGIVIIYILTTLLFAAYSAIKIAGANGSIKDKNPMLPSACAATTIYLLFLWNTTDLLLNL